LVVPPGFPEGLVPEGPWSLLADVPPLNVGQLDEADAVITTVATAIAVTGTVTLDHGPGQGRRVLTLLPDQHICVVRANQIAPDIPEALRLLDPHRPLTLVSGPSATSDIELDRVEGVHGPRTLDIVVVVDA
jgi:L-lactate dehydrogenase complex protein LldG